MKRVKSNPEWADEVTVKFCDAIRKASRRFGLPLPILTQECRLPDSSLLGEGAYGVAYITDESDCVFKITTDSTEAHFVATAINLRENHGVDPKGIVDLRAVFALPEKHDGFDVFIIWRERAIDVGVGDTGRESRFAKLLSGFYDSSDRAFRFSYEELERSDTTHYWKWIAERIELARARFAGCDDAFKSDFSDMLLLCYKLAEGMERQAISREVGRALKSYMDAGIILCDVHLNNVGRVERGGCQPLFVITDPGHALILDQKLSSITIPVLEA